MDVVAALDEVVGALPGGGEPRLGQRQMAQAVADAITNKRHLVVQAGTGTGKTLAYLVPTILLGAKVVVATLTNTVALGTAVTIRLRPTPARYPTTITGIAQCRR